MKIRLQSLLIILTAILFFTACEKKDSAISWNISGEVLIEDALIPEITTPLPGVTVYLLNSPFAIDTTTLWFSKTDILDSTKTDVNGFYKFSQLQAGDYVVMPADSIAGYFFDWSASPDSIWTSINNKQTDYEINFTTPEAVSVNSSDQFRFVFNVDASSQYIRIFRKRKNRKWDWYHFVWSDWKWHETALVYRWAHPFGIPETLVHNEQNSNSNLFKYADEFRVEIGFIRDKPEGVSFHPPVITFDVVNLKQINTWDVIWKSFQGDVEAIRLD